MGFHIQRSDRGASSFRVHITAEERAAGVVPVKLYNAEGKLIQERKGRVTDGTCETDWGGKVEATKEGNAWVYRVPAREAA